MIPLIIPRVLYQGDEEFHAIAPLEYNSEQIWKSKPKRMSHIKYGIMSFGYRNAERKYIQYQDKQERGQATLATV